MRVNFILIILWILNVSTVNSTIFRNHLSENIEVNDFEREDLNGIYEDGFTEEEEEDEDAYDNEEYYDEADETTGEDHWNGGEEDLYDEYYGNSGEQNFGEVETNDLSYLDSLLESENLKAPTAESHHSTESEKPDELHHTSDNSDESNILESKSTITIAQMKASLKRSGISQAKLDNFLDRESLFEFYQNHFLKLASMKHTKHLEDESKEQPVQQVPKVKRMNYTEMKRRAKEKDWRHKYLFANQGIKEVMLLGGRHSGIGWVSSLLHMNAPAWKVVHASRRHHLFRSPNNALSSSSGYSGSSGGDVMVSRGDSKPIIDMDKVNTTLVLMIVQDPFTWVASMHERHPHGAISSYEAKKHREKSRGVSSSVSNKPTTPVTNPKHHAYKGGVGGRKKKKKTQVTARHLSSMDAYVRSAWRDEEGLEFESIAAMRTEKAYAILEQVEKYPDMRFGIVRIEDLMQDSEVAMRSVLTSCGVEVPWRLHHWKERLPTEPEWFDLDSPTEPWHKPLSYYLSHQEVLKQYTPKSAHAMIKHLNVSLEEKLGYLPHPLLNKPREEVDNYFHSRTAGRRVLSTISKFTAKAGAFLVATPLLLLGIFLPLASAYGAWMRYRYFNVDNGTVGGAKTEKDRNKTYQSGTGGVYDENYDGGGDGSLNEQEEAILMENTFSRRQKLSNAALRRRRQSGEGSQVNMGENKEEEDDWRRDNNYKKKSNTYSTADEYASMMKASSIAEEYKAISKGSKGKSFPVKGLVDEKEDNANVGSSTFTKSLSAASQKKKLVARARQRLMQEARNLQPSNQHPSSGGLIGGGASDRGEGGGGLLLSGLSMVDHHRAAIENDWPDNSDSDDSDDYIPDDFEGGGYFELYGDMSQGIEVKAKRR